MTLARILVPVRGDGRGEGVLAHAVTLARRFSAHIETIHCRAKTEDMMPFGVVVPAFLKEQIASSMTRLADSEEEHLKGLFDHYTTAAGLDVVEPGALPPSGRASLTWHEVEGRQADIVGVRGRLADLICVAQPDRDTSLGLNTLYAGLVQAGRPCLMCPPGEAPADPLAHLAIAWNGSTEAARAVALGSTLIGSAGRVSIVTGGATDDGVSAEDFARTLAVRGITADIRSFRTTGDIGGAILHEAGDCGASALLMGAYHQSRGREQLFGGVSQHIVEHATLPVVMVH
ncbi:MAG: universal stress protein [Pseudomonadota bacterium]